MNLKNFIRIYVDKGCSRVYVKNLVANDNSKNQVYLGGSFDVLNIFPITDINSDDSGKWKRTRFKSKFEFYWLSDEGNEYPAPYAQLILYPKYPEVRFSGFLRGCENAPSVLMTSRIENRLLFFGVNEAGNIFGYVTAPDSELAREFNSISGLEEQGLFRVLTIRNKLLQKDTKELLLRELKRIHLKGWITSKRLGINKKLLPCVASNCGGYTLEAELGITPNGYSDPDFLGWEVKQFGVTDFLRFHSSIITLMTPEPTGGYYVDKGVRAFIEKFGYADKMGRADRINFGGIHKIGQKHPTTGLTLMLPGFDTESGKITHTDGRIALVGRNDVEAASWSFTDLLKHWNRKHAKASYVPSKHAEKPEKQYYYGNNIVLGIGTDFTLFLKQMSLGYIYYDPGIKLENISTKPLTKRRSQFRIKSLHLPSLYRNNEVVDLMKL